MSTGICPAVITYCAPGQLPAPPCPCTLAPHAVPTLGAYGMMIFVLLIAIAGIAALWWLAAQRDRWQRQHGPQPRYPHAAEDATTRPGIAPINNICPRHGWPCDSIAKRCSGCGKEL